MQYTFVYVIRYYYISNKYRLGGRLFIFETKLCLMLIISSNYSSAEPCQIFSSYILFRAINQQLLESLADICLLLGMGTNVQTVANHLEEV